MRKALGAAAVTAALLLGPISAATAVPVAQADEGGQTQDTQDDDGDNGLWGLAGLLGLAGLAGLKRREHTTERGRIDRAP